MRTNRSRRTYRQWEVDDHPTPHAILRADSGTDPHRWDRYL